MPSAGEGARERPLSPSALAETFLREALAAGPRLSNDLLAEAKTRAISRATLYRAIERLGVIKDRDGEHSSWQMPDEQPPVAEEQPTLETATPLPRAIEITEHRQFFYERAHYAFYEEDVETSKRRIFVAIAKGVKHKVLR